MAARPRRSSSTSPARQAPSSPPFTASRWANRGAPTLDCSKRAKQARAGPALAIAAIGSFFAGCVATVLIAVLGAPLTRLALAFGPAEYFSLMVLGLIFAVVLAKGSVLKAIAMIVFGLLLSMVGSDIETGASRMA